MSDSKPLRVLHIITRMIVGGAQENTLLSVEGLDRLPEYEVTLLSGIDNGVEGDLLTRARHTTKLIVVPQMARDINPLSDVIVLWKLYRLIKQGRYHIVHTHASKAGVLGRIAAKLAGTPIIVHTLHGAVFHDYQPWYINRFWRLVKRACAPLTDQFISVSRILAENLSAAKILPLEKCVVIHSGMELDWYLDCKADPQAVRREFGIPSGAPVVGKVARLVPQKGHEYLVAAAPEIVKRHPDVRFFLIGDGHLQEQVRTQASELGVLDNFIFAGLMPRERVPEMISAMDVLVHTGLWEGLARVLPQAFAMGKPCVSFDTDGSPEVVIPGETGYLVRQGDTLELANCVSRLLSDPQLRKRMGEAGRRRVDPAFRAETMVHEIAELYATLAERYAERLARFDRRRQTNSNVLDNATT